MHLLAAGSLLVADAGRAPGRAPEAAAPRGVASAVDPAVAKAEVGGGQAALGWRIRAGTVVISTREDLDSEQVTRAYDVSDLLEAPGVHVTPAARGGEGSAELADAGKGSGAYLVVAGRLPQRECIVMEGRS